MVRFPPKEKIFSLAEPNFMFEMSLGSLSQIWESDKLSFFILRK